MKDKNSDSPGDAARSAADWFLELDRRSGGTETEPEFDEWLDSDSEHPAAFARVQGAAHLTGKLRDDGRVAWAFAEAEQIAARAPRKGMRTRIRSLYRSPGLAWGTAALSAVIAVLALFARNETPPAPGAASASGAGSAAIGIPGLATFDRVAVLPGSVVVDVGSVAVLPFAGEEAGADSPAGPDPVTLATTLYEQVLRQLESIPGVYVVGSRPVEPYLGTDLPLEQIAAQLGVRSIVQGRVQAGGGRVQVLLSMTDAANHGRLTEDSFERPLTQLDSMRSEIASNIVLALSEPVEPASESSGFSEGVSE